MARRQFYLCGPLVRGVGGTSNGHTMGTLTRRFRICINLKGPIYIVHVTACLCLTTPLDFQEEQEEEQQQAKRVLMVMDDPLDHGHGKKKNVLKEPPFKSITENKQTKMLKNMFVSLNF